MKVTIQTEILSDASKVYNIILACDDGTVKIAMDSRGAANDAFDLLARHGSWIEVSE
jgi:hypothetical protein